MKFSSTMDSLSRENQYLRYLILILGVAIIFVGTGVILLHDKDPVVVERTTQGLEIVRLTPLRRSPEDIQQAVRLMLKARFDSDAVAPEVFLDLKQVGFRKGEQAEMKSRALTQAIIVRSVLVTESDATAEIDRVIGVGEVRSALKTKIRLAFESVEPNELNPYGLKLALADVIEAPANVPATGTADRGQEGRK
jgi:hypothetical protein